MFAEYVGGFSCGSDYPSFQPAIKLLEFFRTMSAADSAARTSGRHDVEAGGITPLATEKIQQVSPTMATLKPIEASEAQSWVKYWVAKEFF